MKITEPTLHLASLELHGIVVTGQCQFFPDIRRCGGETDNMYLLMESHLSEVPCRETSW